MDALTPTAAADETIHYELADRAETDALGREPLLPADSPLLKGLEVTLEARLGQAVMPVAELLALRAGSILGLETRMNEPVELFLNGALVGRGEIVAVDDHFGVRIAEIAT